MDFFKNFISYIIVPITLFCILYVLTGLLLTERDLRHDQPVLVEPPIGLGAAVPQDMRITDWYPYYGGGEGVDRVVTTDTASLRVTTGGDGGWYGARADVSSVNFTDSAISFSVRFFDWEQLDRVMLLFSSGSDFANYYGLNLKNYFAYPQDNEWIDVVIERSEFYVIEGSPQWEFITDVAVRVVPKPGVSTRVWFDGLATVPEQRNQAMISMTFDDGFAAVREAEAIMTASGMQGTAYVIPELLGTPNYMTQEDVDYIHDQGWDISGHGKDNLTELSAPDVDTHLAAMTEYLMSNNYQGRQHFAYPNGAYNQSVQSQVLEYFDSARTIDGFHQPPEYLFPYNVNAVTISSSTQITEVVEHVSQAVENNSWLILVWHDFSMDPKLDVQYNTQDFKWIVDYISDQDVLVRPYSETWDYVVNAQPLLSDVEREG